MCSETNKLKKTKPAWNQILHYWMCWIHIWNLSYHKIRILLIFNSFKYLPIYHTRQIYCFQILLCFIICLFRALFQTDAKWQWLHLFNFSPECQMHSHTGCICVAFLQCALSNVSSNCLQKRMQIHIGYI